MKKNTLDGIDYQVKRNEILNEILFLQKYTRVRSTASQMELKKGD